MRLVSWNQDFFLFWSNMLHLIFFFFDILSMPRLQAIFFNPLRAFFNPFFVSFFGRLLQYCHSILFLNDNLGQRVLVAYCAFSFFIYVCEADLSLFFWIQNVLFHKFWCCSYPITTNSWITLLKGPKNYFFLYYKDSQSLHIVTY